MSPSNETLEAGDDVNVIFLPEKDSTNPKGLDFKDGQAEMSHELARRWKRKSAAAHLTWMEGGRCITYDPFQFRGLLYVNTLDKLA